MTIINEAIFRVIDTETTGFDPKEDQIVEVAYVDVDMSLTSDITKDAIVNRYEQLVNPDRIIPPDASAIHHITERDIKDAPFIDQVLLQVIPEPADNGQPGVYFAAHNAKFDMEHLGLYEEFEALCTWRLASHLWPEKASHGNQYLRYDIGLIIEEVDGLPAHRALADAIVTAHILMYMITWIRSKEEWAGVINTVEDLIHLSNKPIKQEYPRFGKHSKRGAEPKREN